MAGNYTTNGLLSLLDGADIKSYDIFIENVGGFLDLPDRKETLEHSWPDDHGLDIDLSLLRYKERKCSMSLIIKGSTYADMVSAINTFFAALKKTGYRYLKLYGIEGIFLVYVSGSIGVSRLKRGVTNVQLARLSIPLIEPYPIKYMYYTDQSESFTQVSLQITTSKPVTIDWGDHTTTAVSTSGTKNHDYSVSGEYCIVIYGGVDGITNINPTNCELISGPTGQGSITADRTDITVDSTIITADQI